MIAKVSSQHPGAIRWRDMAIEYRPADKKWILVEEIYSTIHHNPASSCTPRTPVKRSTIHTTPCRVCGGGSVGEGSNSRETAYDSAMELLKSIDPHRGLPLQLVWLAAGKDTKFGESLIEYLDDIIVPQ